MTKPILEPQLVRIRRQDNRVCELDSDLFDWMPSHVRCPAQRITVDYTPSSSAVAAFGAADLQSPADFLRTIPIKQGPKKGSYGDPFFLPWQPAFLEILCHPAARVIVLAAGNQQGKTTIVESYVAWCAKNDPKDCAIFYPGHDTASKKFRATLIPIFKSKKFKYLCTGKEDDLSGGLIQLSLMSIHAGNTTSVMSMSTYSFHTVVIEEADKVVEDVSETETSVKFLLDGRRESYGADGRTIWVSTLSVDGAPCSKELAVVQMRIDFLPRCPFCGLEHQLDDKHLDYVIDNKMFSTESNILNVRYVCPQCKAKWTEADRKQALLAGRFAARENGWRDKLDKAGKYGHDPRPILEILNTDAWPESIGTAIPALASPQVSMLRIAGFVEQAKTDIAAAKYLANHIRAETFSLSGHRRQPEAILKRSWGQPRGVVPPASDDLTYILCGCDTQHDSLYYCIVAYGWPYTRDGHSSRPKAWVIDYGNIPTTIDQHGEKVRLPIAPILDQLEARKFRDIFGNEERSPGVPYRINSLVIDGRGNTGMDKAGNRYKEVKEWAALTSGTMQRYMSWGEQHDFKGELYRWSKTSDPLRPGFEMLRLDIDRNATEFEVESMLLVGQNGPGALQVSNDCDLLFAQHLCAAQLNQRTGRMEPIAGQRRDWRDCVRQTRALYDAIWSAFKQRVATEAQSGIGDQRRVLAPWMR
jgi:hypothetical protein